MEPMITCPKCKQEIKLTESLAAPLLESARREFEKRLADKDADSARREASIREQEAALSQAKASLEEQVAEKLKSERVKIAAEEGKKARLTLSTLDANEK